MSTENHIFTLQREEAKEPFRAEIPGVDGVLTFAHTASVDQFELAELFAADQVDLEFVTSMFRLALSGEDYVKLREAKLSRPEIDKLYKAYAAHCGVGESKASSD